MPTRPKAAKRTTTERSLSWSILSASRIAVLSSTTVFPAIFVKILIPESTVIEGNFQGEILHPSLLQRVNPTISEQASTAEGTSQRCPGSTGRNRAVKRHQERTVIEHYIHGGRMSSNLAQPL